MIDFNAMIMGSGGLSGLSDMGKDMLMSAANKYAAPAIQEESI